MILVHGALEARGGPISKSLRRAPLLPASRYAFQLGPLFVWMMRLFGHRMAVLSRCCDAMIPGTPDKGSVMSTKVVTNGSSRQRQVTDVPLSCRACVSCPPRTLGLYRCGSDALGGWRGMHCSPSSTAPYEHTFLSRLSPVQSTRTSKDQLSSISRAGM